MKVRRFDPADDLIIVKARLFGPRGYRPLSLAFDTAATETHIVPEILDDLGYSPRQGEAITSVSSAASLRDLEEQLGRLTDAEKAQLMLKLLPALSHAFAGIEKRPDICGGDACVVRTRIPAWTLERYRRLGWTEAKILDNFPSLRAADLVNVWAYIDAHVEEIEAAIRENDEA